MKRKEIYEYDVLIISPNKVFGHYISRVLPELGEEMVGGTTMEALANELLDERYKFQSFADQVSLLLRKSDKGLEERVGPRRTEADVLTAESEDDLQELL